jgi:membrane-bound lytic murein transglycosylase MltF
MIRRYALALALALFANACSNGGSNAEPPATSTASAPAAPATAAATPPDESAEPPRQNVPPEEALPDDAMLAAAMTPWTGDLDGMIERRMIRVLTTNSKINYFVDAARQRGLIYDAMKLFEDDLNRSLKRKELRVHVLFMPVPHDQLIPALLEGRGDIVAAGTLLTEWRRAQVATTIPTRRNISALVVSGPGVPPVATPEDLSGRTVFLRASDVSKQNVDGFNAKLTKAGKPPVVIEPAPEVFADEDLLEMVNAGLVPMTVVDDQVAEFWHQVFPSLVINRGAAVRSGLDVGMLVRKESPKLLGELNAFLKRYPEGSKERNILFREYLKSQKHVRNAATAEEAAKLKHMVELFRKYGDQYDLDFLLMAAQGYQESGLNQNAKSHVGAIGVMQVMPATGKELAVGDITQLEANIHAGVKYVRRLEDTYFNDPAIDDLNKALFSFASYNAGPGRIRELRKRTQKRGLNPNIWFNNVEVITSEVVGRETVQYVSNIYKYYVAYKMMLEQRDLRNRAREQLKKVG